MKFERTPRFENDFKALQSVHQKSFLGLMREFNTACDLYTAKPGEFVWPKRLRVSRLKSAKGIWEMTWSFASPDGRATFEFIKAPDGLRLRWRRIGNHDVYREP